MSLPWGTTWEMAEQFYEALNLLIADIEQERLEDYKIAVAVLYLYRHWLELAVKSIVGQVRVHDLVKLSAKLTSVVEKRGMKLPAWIGTRLDEIARIDPASTAFRYSNDGIDGEIYVSLTHLKQIMTALHAAFSSFATSGAFPPAAFE
jgi:hypothetical protein